MLSRDAGDPPASARIARYAHWQTPLISAELERAKRVGGAGEEHPPLTKLAILCGFGLPTLVLLDGLLDVLLDVLPKFFRREAAKSGSSSTVESIG
jgi:hypothetical protein